MEMAIFITLTLCMCIGFSTRMAPLITLTVIEMALSIPSGDGKIALKSIADRIIYEDNVDAYYTNDQLHFIDAHGEHILDLDGVGIVDLYIVQGGMD